MKIVRVVLDESVTEANVDSTGWDLQWSIGKVIKAEGNTPRQVIYYEEEEGQKTFIRYIEDFYIDLPYIEVYGKNDSSVKSVVEEIHDFLPTHSITEVIEMVKKANTRDELLLAMRYLGIGCGGQTITPEIIELFQKLAFNPDPDMREAGIITMVYAGAPEFEEIFEYLAKNDSEPDIREHAARSLKGLREYVINQPTS